MKGHNSLDDTDIGSSRCPHDHFYAINVLSFHVLVHPNITSEGSSVLAGNPRHVDIRTSSGSLMCGYSLRFLKGTAEGSNVLVESDTSERGKKPYIAKYTAQYIQGNGPNKRQTPTGETQGTNLTCDESYSTQQNDRL